MSVPILFFFKGYDPYIAFALWQARQRNPGAPIYLLGDESNDLSLLGIRHVRFRDYPGKRDQLVDAYQHLSVHELECERLCIERWFHLAAFVEQQRMDQFIYLDSDFLLTMGMDSLLPTWREYEVAGIPGFYGACYFGRRQLLGEFCDYVLDLYRDAGQVERWRQAYEFSVRHPGAPAANVSDMLLSEMFLAARNSRCLDLRQPRHGIVFNDNFIRNGEQPLEVFRRAEDEAIYARVDGQMTRLAGLHFIGWSKRLLSAFTGWSRPLVRCFLKPNYRRNMKKLMQHYYFGLRFRRQIAPLPRLE
jgi:hypothetical protein